MNLNGKRNSADHTWVICAYQESPYFEKCIRSLLRQTVASRILAVTSTPNAYIRDLVRKYDIPLYVNTGDAGIVQDWNFAVARAHTRYVTIAHQDDVYENRYLERALTRLERAARPLLFFSDYYELRDGKKVAANRNLRIKRLMLLPFRSRLLGKNRLVRRSVLAFGCPIDCPSVTYVIPNLPEKLFDESFRAAQDWEAWERISRLQGEFLYDPQLLMGHRIHGASATTEYIADNTRSREELTILRRFWPEPAARFIAHYYRKGQRSNWLQKS